MILEPAVAQDSQEKMQDPSQRETFIRLIEQYEPALRRLASGYVEQQADREDLFQEIAIGLWKAIPHFRGDSSERTWLYRIAHNIAVSSSVRLHGRGRREEALLETMDYPSAASNGEQEVLRAEKQALLLCAIRNLPAIDRQLALLHLEGLNYAQIGEISGCSQSAVASRLSRIRDKLREHVHSGRRSSDER